VSRRRRRRNVDGPFDDDEVFAITLFCDPERLSESSWARVANLEDRWRRYGGAVLAVQAEADREHQQWIDEKRAAGYTRWPDHEPGLPILIAAYGVPDGWTPADLPIERTN
jgi:hypothetical protein